MSRAHSVIVCCGDEMDDSWSEFADRLGMRQSTAQSRLDRLREFEVELPGDYELPDEDTARSLLGYCSVPSDDQNAMLSARPDVRRDPDWWMLLRGTVGELRSRMDRPLPAAGYAAWPTVSEDAGPVGMFLYAWSLLAVVPELLAVHERRGIDRDITTASLSDLSGVMSSHLEVTGHRGVGLFPLWGPPLSFCGADLTIGRHAFTRAEIQFGDGVAGWVLHVHVPPIGALDEAESTASIDRALAVFREHYPDEPLSALICRSWLLDPQLRGVLPAEGNILRFQARWSLLPHVPLVDVWEDDREMMRLGLQLRTPDEGPLSAADLDAVPTDTRLQRGFVDLIRSGGHWHKRTGVRSLIGPAPGS